MEIEATLGDECEIWEHLHSFREVKACTVIPRLYDWVYKTWRFFQLADEHSVASGFVTAGSQSRWFQIASYG